MHGSIFAELRKYVTTKHDAATWDTLLADTGLQGRNYMALLVYPDEELVALVGAASKRTGTPAEALLRDFGEFIAPDLLALYKAYVKPEWSALDVIEHTEGTIHKVVRMRDKGATPPYLEAHRVSPTEVKVVYTSQRRLCAVAKGIVAGISKHYKQPLRIEETECMHRGAPRCTLRVIAS